ncbi:hypothetical protein M404DRAFT_117201, partial [Pisolithus tinctorius Marx 270]
MSLSVATTSSGIYAMPKLTEKNWVEYKTKTVMSLTARGLACHLDGTVSTPQPLPVDDKTALSDAFRQKEVLAIQQLYAIIPNSILIQVQHLDCLADIWLAIWAIYETKSDMMQVDIQSCLQNM